MSALLDKMKKSGTIKSASILSRSLFFTKKDHIPTDLPILNLAFSGDLDSGLVSGLTIFAGASKSFKTMLGLYCLKAYFNKYDDAVCLLYDSEGGTTPEYLKTFGIDTDRIIHIPIENVEQLKFDMVKRLEQIERGDRVFILVDSLGSLASKKEVDDAIEEKSVADMSRAKAIRSLLRITTPYFNNRDIPCIIINHVYQTQEMYSKTVIPGGTMVTYAAQQIFVITKAQEKDGTEIVGWNFTINIEKSRFVREKSKFPFLVKYDGGISKWSGLMDIAIDGGFVVKPKTGWFSRIDLETGEIEQKSWRLKDTNCKDFWLPIVTSTKFKDYVKKKYQIANGSIMAEDQIDEALSSIDIDDLDADLVDTEE